MLTLYEESSENATKNEIKVKINSENRKKPLTMDSYCCIIITSSENRTKKKKGAVNLAFDYSKLRGKIREVFGTQDKFAKALGISGATLSLKLNNVSEFTQQEMAESMRLLHEPACSVDKYFFCLTSSENRTKA